MIRLSWLSLSLVLLAGCAKPPLYFWGSYESQIYQSYRKPGSVPPEKQIEALEQDYQIARSKNLRMPPGWHIHLGTLYYQVGKIDQAAQEFNTEKAQFPESAIFVDRLQANMKKQ